MSHLFTTIPFRKSKDDAIKLKNLGNEHFSKHDDFKAFQCYTKVLIMASVYFLPPFGGRSDVLLMYTGYAAGPMQC